MRQKIRQHRDFPGGPVVKTSASNAEGAGLMPGQGGKIPPCSVAKKKKTQKQYCNKFNEDFDGKKHKKTVKKNKCVKSTRGSNK